MHKVAEQIQSRVSIPLVHIADATAEALLANDISRVGLLGTRYTMEDDFYASRLESEFGIEAVIPDAAQRDAVPGQPAVPRADPPCVTQPLPCSAIGPCPSHHGSDGNDFIGRAGPR